MSNLQVRFAAPEDVGRIVDFNAAMASETEGLKLDISRLSRGVRAVFGDREKGFYLVAELDSQVRACLMVTTEWSDWRNGYFWWIQSVYVQKEYRQRGLYKAMYRHLQNEVDQTDSITGLRLYVEQENEIAQNAYSKLGMNKTNYLLFETSKTKLN